MTSLPNQDLNQDDKTPPEYIIVNENSRNITSEKTIPYTSSTNPLSLEGNNLVVNKLYDIASKKDINMTNHCNNNGSAQNKNLTMVENPSYLDTHMTAMTTPSLAPIKTAEDTHIDSNDLLDFAIQIANGMVS